MRQYAVRGAAIAVLLLALPIASFGDDHKLELVVQTGHTDRVDFMAFSPDSKFVVTGGHDGTAIVWEVATGRKLHTLAGHERWDVPVAYSPDGQLIATGAKDGQVTLWDPTTGKKVRHFQPHKNRGVYSLAFAPNEKWIASGSSDKTVAISDVTSGQIIETIRGFDDWVTSVAFSPKGEWLGAGGLFKGVKVVETRTWEDAGLFGETTGVNSIAFTPDGKYLLAGGTGHNGNGEHGLWSIANRKEIRRMKGSGGVLVLSPGGKVLAIRSADNSSVDICELFSGKTVRKITLNEGVIQGLTYSPDGAILATGHSDGSANLSNAIAGRKLRALGSGIENLSVLACSPKGDSFVAGGKQLLSWDLRAGRARQLPSIKRKVDYVGFGPKELLAAGGVEQKVCVVWNAETGKPRGSFSEGNPKGADNKIDTMAFSRNQEWVAVHHWNDERGVTVVYDLKSGKPRQQFLGATKEDKPWPKCVKGIAISPGGEQLVTGENSLETNRKNECKVWELKTGKELHTIPGAGAAIAYSPNGKTIAIARGKNDGVDVFDVGGWDVLANLKSTHGYGSVCFSPDGSLLAAGPGNAPLGSRDTRMGAIWRVQDWQKLGHLSGETHGLRSVVFSHDSKLVLSPLTDGTVAVWDVASMRQVMQVIASANGRDWLAVTPEGLFDGTPDGMNLVTYRIAGTDTIVPVERYYEGYYTPGLVAKVFAGEKPKPKVEKSKATPPKVGLLRPEASTLKQAQVTVEAKAESPNELSVTRMRLLIDGRPLDGGRSDKRAKKAGKTLEASWEVELTPGDHTLQVLAYNSEEVEGLSVARGVRFVGKPQREKPVLHVLAIGVSDYGGNRNLPRAAKDAELIAASFKQHSGTLYKEVKVNVLTDKKATRAEIIKAVKQFRKDMNSESHGVVYLGCHGESTPDDKLYFAPHGTDFTDLESTGILSKELTDQFAATGGRLLVLFDTCFSGKAINTRSVNELTIDELVRLSQVKNGVFTICAASSGQKAQDGVFAQAFAEALAGKPVAINTKDGKKDLPVDTDGNGTVSLAELKLFLIARVKDLSKGYQDPVARFPPIPDVEPENIPVSKPKR